MSNEVFTLVLASVKEAVENANNVAGKISAATTDRTKHIHELRTEVETDDPVILEYREWLEKANAAIEERTRVTDEHIAKSIPSVSEDDLNALKEQYKAAKTQYNAAINFVKTIPGWTDELLKDVPDLRTIRGGNSSGGTGAKRPRIERLSYSLDNGKTYTEIYTKVKDKKTGEEVEKTNFTLAAKTLGALTDPATKIEVKDLQAAAFDAAKTEDLSTLNGKVFEFAYSVGSGDKAKNVFVRVQPRAGEVSEEDVSEETESDETETENEENEEETK